MGWGGEGRDPHGMESVFHFIQMEWMREDYWKRQSFANVSHHNLFGILYYLSFPIFCHSSMCVIHQCMSFTIVCQLILSVIHHYMSFPIVCLSPLSAIFIVSYGTTLLLLVSCLHWSLSCVIVCHLLVSIIHYLIFPIVCHSPLFSSPITCHSSLYVIHHCLPFISVW